MEIPTRLEGKNKYSYYSLSCVITFTKSLKKKISMMIKYIIEMNIFDL